jgi:4a-hydroxytetrahydrobiopterin dehydratase
VFSFSTFPDGISFVTRVADLAEEAEHHPDIDIRYSTVTLRLATHSEGGITQKDADLARRIDGLLR